MILLSLTLPPFAVEMCMKLNIVHSSKRPCFWPYNRWSWMVEHGHLGRDGWTIVFLCTRYSNRGSDFLPHAVKCYFEDEASLPTFDIRVLFPTCCFPLPRDCLTYWVFPVYSSFTLEFSSLATFELRLWCIQEPSSPWKAQTGPR